MTLDTYATTIAARSGARWTDDPAYQDAYADAADEYAACMAYYRAAYDAEPGAHDDRMEAVYAADVTGWSDDLTEAVMVALDQQVTA